MKRIFVHGEQKQNKTKQKGVKMVTAIILALIALGTFTAVVLLSWALASVCEWVFNLFDTKDSNNNITIGEDTVMEEVVAGLKRKGADGVANRLENALAGAGAKKISVWRNENNVQSIDVLEARDVTVDELNGKIIRFNKDRTIEEY